MSGQIGNRSCIENCEHGGLRFYPDGVSRAKGLAGAGEFGINAGVETNRTFNGFNDCGNRCGAACGKDLKATELSTMRCRKAGPAKALKNLGEKALRSSGGMCQLRQ